MSHEISVNVGEGGKHLLTEKTDQMLVRPLVQPTHSFSNVTAFVEDL